MFCRALLSVDRCVYDTLYTHNSAVQRQDGTLACEKRSLDAHNANSSPLRNMIGIASSGQRLGRDSETEDYVCSTKVEVLRRIDRICTRRHVHILILTDCTSRPMSCENVLAIPPTLPAW